ncbi:response regulator [Planctomycetota bacterium]
MRAILEDLAKKVNVKMGIRIVLVDDHGIIREGLKTLLGEEPHLDVVGQAADGWQAVQLVRQVKPDVVISDISMPNLNGIDATREIVKEYPETKVIALSIHCDRSFVRDMLKAGASAYVLKEGLFNEVLEAIETVTAGGIYLSPKVAGVVVSDYVMRLSDHTESPLDCLSTRQRQVLQMVAEGKNTKVIARQLHLSTKAIEACRRKIMDILDVHSVAEMVKVAIAGGLTSLD